MSKKRSGFHIWFSAGLLILLVNFHATAGNNFLDLPAPFDPVLNQLRNGRYRQTLDSARNLEKAFPAHPLPPLLVAEADWGLIYCQTGNINSREVRIEADVKSNPLDHDFFAATDEALRDSDRMRRSPQTQTLGLFYDGLAHAVRARLYTLRAQALKAAQEGKQMRASLLEAVARDSSLEPDAAAGLGVYNYYADVLSPILKVFRFLLLLPAGDREKGLQQLQLASDKATLLVTESANELARIYTYHENRPADALVLFRKLSDEYPDNAFFSLAAATQSERLGKKDAAADYARKAILASKQMDAECRTRLEPAAREALERIQK